MRYVVALLPILFLAGCGGGNEQRVVPDVRGQRLDRAERVLADQKLDWREEGSSGAQALVRSNWKVCGQAPGPPRTSGGPAGPARRSTAVTSSSRWRGRRSDSAGCCLACAGGSTGSRTARSPGCCSSRSRPSCTTSSRSASTGGPSPSAPHAAILGLGDSHDLSDDAIGLLGLGLAGIYAALGLPVLRRRRDIATVLWGLGLLLALPASGLVIQDQWLVSAWAAAAALLAVLAHRLREERFEVAAIGYAGLALLGTLIVGAQPNDLVVSGSNPGAGLPSLAAVIGAVLAIAYFGSRRVSTLWAAGGLIVYGLSLAILELAQHVGSASVATSFQRGHTGVSALWGGLGLALLIVGLKRDSRALRLGGLGLLAVSLGKLFLYDLATLSSVTRALSFLAVGAVLLLGAFFYQRAAQDERPRMS